MKPLIGIDLGTTNSLCSVFESGQPRLIKNALGEFLTPSVVGLLASGELIVGEPAKDLQVVQPDRCASTFKRQMGTDQTKSLATRAFSGAELSSVVLRSLKHDAEAELGVPVTDVVITVPAYFNDPQRQATRLAGELAGLNVLRIINEPTAAALTYGFHDRDACKNLLVFDLGGGTFDVTLMETFEGTLEIVSTAGESFLGGEDFTYRLMAWALECDGAQIEACEVVHPQRFSRLRQIVEGAKRDLSTAESCRFFIPEMDGQISESSRDVELTRRQANEICGSLLKRLERPVARALRDANLGREDIDEVILVGGATRMPMIADFVLEYFGREPSRTHDPDRVVALGACIEAALIRDDRSVSDLVKTDVCPFTLGVEVMKSFGNSTRDGYFMPIIHRNTTLPVVREESVATVHDNQTELTVKCYQGESRRAEDNHFLGELCVTNIPLGPKGTTVCIRFAYDLSGLLDVEAFVPATGAKFQTLLTNNVKNLSRKEIARAAAKLERLKFFPRDDMDNQRLLRFAERVVGEINPIERDGLEVSIDAYELGMASLDREVFEATRANLVTVLAALGYTADPNHDG